jgi:hypothetical protein
VPHLPNLSEKSERTGVSLSILKEKLVNAKPYVIKAVIIEKNNNLKLYEESLDSIL